MDYMYYQVIMNYRVKVDDKGLMIGKPELMNGFVPKQKKAKVVTPDANLSEINSVEL